MDITDLRWPLFVTCMLVATGVCWTGSRKFLFGLLDPWLLVTAYQALIIGTMGYFALLGAMEPSDYLYVLGCFGALLVGMRVFYRPRPAAMTSSTLLTRQPLRVAILVTVCILIVNNLAIYVLIGIPALVPGARSITLYSQLGRGGGVFYYLNQGLLALLPVLIMKALVIYRDRRWAVVSLAVVGLVMVGLGGKSGFLTLFSAYGMALYYRWRTTNIPPRPARIIYALMPLLAGVVLYGFVNVAASGYEATVLTSFIKRVVNTAAGPYYYFVLHAKQGFSGLSLLSYHLSQISPYFGLPDQNAIQVGVHLTEYSDLRSGTPGFGPNPTFYVVGHIAWQGAGVLYALMLGALMSFVRYRWRAGFIPYLLVNTLVGDMLMDGTLMPLYLFYAILLSPVLVAAALLVQAARVSQRRQIHRPNPHLAPELGDRGA